MTVGWGICGTGSIAGRFATALRRVASGHLAAVASRTQEKADAFASEHAVPRAWCGLAAMLADPDVDVVYVASPHSEHCSQALQAIESGKHVLVEKPFGLSLAQVEPVLAAASQHGVFVMEAMWSRFLPAQVRLRELAGSLGEIRSIEASFGFAAPFVPSHRIYDPALGGGALLDIGVYPIDVAVQLLGPPQHVSAEAVLCPTGVDVDTLVAMRWDDGAVASAQCSFTAALSGTARVLGSSGSIEVPADLFAPESLTVNGVVVDLPVGGDGLRYQVEEVHRCLAGGRSQSDIMSWQHTRELMGTLDRARAAIGLDESLRSSPTAGRRPSSRPSPARRG